MECKPLNGGGAEGQQSHHVRHESSQGRAVQVAPIKPTLKAPGPMYLKLRYDGTVLNFAFKFSLRRYTKGFSETEEVVQYGRAVQVDPIKPPLKSPVSRSLKLEYIELLSIVAFKIKLRRYSTGCCRPWWRTSR